MSTVPRIIFLLILLSFSTVTAPATTYYVDPCGSDDANGLSWATAFETVQKGVTVSIDGDVVEVNEGTYEESINISNTNLIIRSIDPNDWDIVGNTVIGGSGDSNTVHLNCGTGVFLVGFTITTDGEYDGIKAYGNNCQGTVSLSLSNCIIKDNVRGVFIENYDLNINDCIIRENTAEGIRVNDGTHAVKNSLIYDNGEGVGLYGGDNTIVNCTIVNNNDYGIRKPGASTNDISNCVLWGNGDDLNSCSATYSCIEDGDSGTGNISSDPRFIDTDANDFHLAWNSPCINRGDSCGSYSGQNDIDGQSRAVWDRVDIGADETDTLFGMKVESVTGDANEVTVVTTGATYVLTPQNMDMYRRIDPNTNEYDTNNGGKGRKVATLTFNPSLGDLSIEDEDAENIATVSSDKATFEFYSDSFFVITAKEAIDVNHTNLIADAPWNVPLEPDDRDLNRLWTDGYGGSLLAFARENTKGEALTENSNSTKVSLAADDQTAHMVFPPKLFDFNGLYGQNSRPFVNFMAGSDHRQLFIDNTNNLRTNLINDGFGTIMLWNDTYNNSFEPELLGGEPNILGYKFSDPNKIAEFIEIAHANDFKVIAYLWRLQDGSSFSGERWVYPEGHPKSGQFQSVETTLNFMKEFQEEYNLDGWFIDGGTNCGLYGDIIDDYEFTRRIRSDIGTDGILFISEGSDTWEQQHDPNLWKATGLRAIMIDAYADYTLTGEDGPFADLNDVYDSSLRFFTASYGMSQAYVSFKNASDNKAALSFGEKHRVLAENLNGCQRNYYYGWQIYFKPVYDVRKAEYLNDANAFDPDVDWPIDPDTGWFRTPTDINVIDINNNSATVIWTTNASSNSKVVYTDNGVWWESFGGPDVNYVSDSNMVTNHCITLTDLEPGTFYEFKIRSSNGLSDVNEIIWGYVGSFNTILLPDAHWWKLDEGSGTTAYDFIDDDDGTFNGSDPCWVEGLFGSAVDFNGISDYFSISSLDSEYTNSDAFTVAGWFKTDISTGAKTIVGQWAQEKLYPEINQYSGWQVLVGGDKVRVRFGVSSSTPTIAGANEVDDDYWHHFAFVHPSYPSASSLYVDGDLDAEPQSLNFGTGDTKFRIGDGSYVISGEPEMKGGPFNGTIDDIMIFDSALTADKVKQLYENGKD